MIRIGGLRHERLCVRYAAAVLARNHWRLPVKVGLSWHKRTTPHAEDARAGPIHLFHVPAAARPPLTHSGDRSVWSPWATARGRDEAPLPVTQPCIARLPDHRTHRDWRLRRCYSSMDLKPYVWMQLQLTSQA